ncbi:MAG: hypothetical protein JWQ02_4052 [Capsulimonas sp.]|nr:hypothetical protein [Capsulimonas sp.]
MDEAVEKIHPELSVRDAALFAAEMKKVDILRLLLERGANGSDEMDGKGSLPIFDALGDLEYTRLLIQYGADLDVTSPEGWPLLEYAPRNCCHDAIALLEEMGLRIN